jgi:hypothetical protein
MVSSLNLKSNIIQGSYNWLHMKLIWGGNSNSNYNTSWGVVNWNIKMVLENSM